MGVFLVHDRKELLDAVRYNYDNYHEGVLIEEYVRGKELYAPIVGTGEDAYVLGVGIARHAEGRQEPCEERHIGRLSVREAHDACVGEADARLS